MKMVLRCPEGISNLHKEVAQMPIIPAFATEVQVYIDSCTVAVVYFR